MKIYATMLFEATNKSRKKGPVYMANVQIIGFSKPESKKLRDDIEGILESLGCLNDSIVVISADNETVTKQAATHDRAPYIVVRHTKLRQARKIGKAINDNLNLDVEIEKIDEFLPKKT